MYFLEAFKMALSAIAAHKLRSFLTLVGIIAGVASIIAVMTGISVIQNALEKEMSVLGSTVFQAQKWPAGGFRNNVNRRKIARRKPLTVAHADAIRENAETVDLVGAELWSFGHILKYRYEATNSTITLCGGTPEYPPNNTHYVQFGRNLSYEDMQVSRKVAVIGPAIADQLFPFSDPIDKEVRLDGRKFRVIGVFEEKSSMGRNFDNYCLIPISRFLSTYGMRDNRGDENSVNITVRAKSPDVVPDAIEEVRTILRQVRNVPPKEEDDFTIFTNDSMIRNFNQVTASIKVGAFVIGIIALVVAGIGIMNIMLVSVTERTKEIGIRKSLGAKRKSILSQFLLEAVLLCNFGGIIGVAVGYGLGNIVTILTGFDASTPLNWALTGLLFCTTVGLTFGMWPAILASKLHPIEALRFE